MVIEIKAPAFAESIDEASLLTWHKSEGETVKRGENLIDIETDKVTLEVVAPGDGVLAEIIKQNGELVKSNELIARIDTEKTSLKSATDTDDSDETAGSITGQQGRVEVGSAESAIKLSPAVRQLLDKHQLTESDIKERKHLDRLTKEDILKHLEQPPPGPTRAAPPAPSLLTREQPVALAGNADGPVAEQTGTPPENDSKQRPQRRVPMTRLRKRAADRLLSAQHENALLTTFNEADMQAVIGLRQRYKEEFQRTHEIKLGFMSFFTRAAAEALKKFPVINASVEGTDIIYHDYYDISIAISSNRGLVVPVLRDVDKLSFADIELQIKALGERANNAQLTIEDLTGGTFTITNGGIFGSLLSTPIVNPPQSAILGMHKIQQRPIVEDGEIIIKPMMYLALSYDHRIIDGREAVQFLVAIKEQIEDPSKILLQI